jgi:ABC-type multidrug transport system fused ATPase/permease subunit
MENGSIVESGTHFNLIEKENGLYRHLSKLQFQNQEA